jgi:imidazole glycerol-phosphate synthase subunit HisH
VRAALVNVGIGNIDSVERALRHLGVPYHTVADPVALAAATHVVLPGVGAFRAGMEALHAHGLVEPLRGLGGAGACRILGVCLGMQLLGAHSEEGDCEGLGLLPFRVRRMQANPAAGVKVPHVGFSLVQGHDPSGLFADLDANADFYFTHSYAVRDVGVPCNRATCHHGEPFAAAFDTGTVCAVQFHPEKSQANGLRLLRNFFSR